MKVSEAYPREYLAAADVGNNQLNVLISHVELRDLGDDTKPVVFFQNKKKGVVLNLVNAKAIESNTTATKWTFGRARKSSCSPCRSRSMAEPPRPFVFAYQHRKSVQSGCPRLRPSKPRTLQTFDRSVGPNSRRRLSSGQHRPLPALYRKPYGQRAWLC